MDKRVWFITGISSGLGNALMRAVMQNGDFAVGSFRQQGQVDDFNSSHKERGVALKVDMTKPVEIEQAVRFIESNFKRIDVVVNNAGFGFAGAIEETSMSEIREVFEANFFGTLQLTQSVLPLLRKQRSGHIIQISSHGGIKAFPGFGIYNASKFALEGFSEALAAEIAPLGIKVTIIEPGPFRTNFAGNSFREARITIAEYGATAGAFRERMKQVNGKQEGDPEKAAQAIINIINSENPPLRLPLGKVALSTITSKLESIRRDLEATKQIAENTVY